MVLKDTRVNSKLLIGFGLINLVFIIVTIFGIYQVNKINDALTIINDVNSVMQLISVEAYMIVRLQFEM